MLLHFFHKLNDLLCFGLIYGLRQFQFNVFAFQFIFSKNIHNIFCQIRICQMLSRQIDRDSHRLNSPLQPIPDILTDLFQYVKVQQTNHTILFQNRHKLHGWNQFSIVFQTGKSFCSYNMVILCLYFRLIICFKIPITKIFRKTRYDLSFL